MTFSFNPLAGLIVVQSRLMGPSTHTEVRLALDTGAVMTLVDRNTLEHLGYDPSVASEYVQMTTGSGVE